MHTISLRSPRTTATPRHFTAPSHRTQLAARLVCQQWHLLPRTRPTRMLLSCACMLSRHKQRRQRRPQRRRVQARARATLPAVARVRMPRLRSLPTSNSSNSVQGDRSSSTRRRRRTAARAARASLSSITLLNISRTDKRTTTPYHHRRLRTRLMRPSHRRTTLTPHTGHHQLSRAPLHHQNDTMRRATMATMRCQVGGCLSPSLVHLPHHRRARQRARHRCMPSPACLPCCKASRVADLLRQKTTWPS